MTVDGQVYEHVDEMTEYRQKYEHNKMSEERCGIKHETITVVSLLFINLVIHFHRLALRNCVFSTPSSTKFLGFVLDWDHSARKVYLSMPNYIQHALHRLQHSLPTSLQHAPHRHNKPVYGQKIQFSDSQDDTKEVFLSAAAKTLIQRII